MIDPEGVTNTAPTNPTMGNKIDTPRTPVSPLPTGFSTHLSSVSGPIWDGPRKLASEDLHLQVGVQSIQGARKTMEDEHTVIGAEEHSSNQSLSFFGVYDGHGGRRAAQFLKQHLHNFVLSHPNVITQPEQALKESIQQAEEEFLKQAKPQCLDDGSTLAVVLVVGTTMVAANVGDSEIVLCRNGKALVLSKIHNIQKSESEEKRVEACGGRVYHKKLGHPHYNPQVLNIAVTRAIGDIIFKDTEMTGGKVSGLIAEPHIKTVSLTTEDSFVILGCDGLWDVMTHQEALESVKKILSLPNSTPQHASEYLVSEAFQRGSQDNITALVATLV